LSDHPNIIITRADKRNVTVVLDRDIYITKMQNLLFDDSTYTVITKDSTKKVCNNLKSLLARWRKFDYISISRYKSLLLTDGIIPRAYGLPKIHKQNFLLRIIVLSINSSLHAFANFLHSILYQHLPRSKSYIKNS
ncbi:hypothetical protein EAG_01380, partial [Camponotus floridanus]